MILRDLLGDCDRWGVQTSGSRAEVRARLRQLYRGELVLKKGCTKHRVQLREYVGPLVPEDCKTSPEKAKSKGYKTSPEKTETKGYKTDPETGEPRDRCRILRPYASTSAATATETNDARSSPEDETIICPRSGLAIPPNLVVGEVVPQIGCVVCKCPLVLRQRLDKTGYFFGCRNFTTARRCKFTLDLPEGLQLYEKARRGERR